MSGSRFIPAAARAALDLATTAYSDALVESPEALEYLARRGIHVDPDIPEDFGNPYRLGLVTDPRPEHETINGRLFIPFLVPQGGPVGYKARCVGDHDCKDLGHAKYLTMPSMGTHLFNVCALKAESDVVGITEGELDAVVASDAGIPSVAVSGVKAWMDHFVYVLEGFSQVLVFGDGDQPGREFAEKLCALIPNARAVPMPNGEDVTSLVVEHGVDALRERCS